MLKEGESIPSFSVPDENGEIVKSADFKGKKYCDLFLSKRLYSRMHHRS